MRPQTLLLTLLAAVALAGCGSSKSGSSADAAPTKEKPKVTVPTGPPPTKLVIKDLRPGTGRAAQGGDTIGVQYVGVLYQGGKEFDSSYKRGTKPFEFILQANKVIPGWDQGLIGMKVGGRRELIIPPKLAYGAQGSPPVIPPNSPLVFVIDLVKVR